ncbi:hypothetical protein COE51_19480 [Bacillus pseudomycoides]|uniref:hypothetical protein n=1 Tax=Bacillus rhizoplanae TaxID=2880966 RepID=UPI000C033822|nr:hypothetical protein COE51_19480 [Bacillus pseudomycoides]
MSDTIKFIAFTLIGISAIFGLLKEFKKTQKNESWIIFETLVLIGVAWVLIGIFV